MFFQLMLLKISSSWKEICSELKPLNTYIITHTLFFGPKRNFNTEFHNFCLIKIKIYNCSDIQMAVFNILWLFADWFPGWAQHGHYNRQPNDDGLSDQDCIEVRRVYGLPSISNSVRLANTFMWNDRDCSTPNYFICERLQNDGKKFTRQFAPCITCKQTFYSVSMNRTHRHWMACTILRDHFNKNLMHGYIHLLHKTGTWNSTFRFTSDTRLVLFECFFS